MKQSLQLRTSQHLTLTPQLQQSIRLLQLSTLELHQELETLLIENPLLERVDDPLDSAIRLLADGAISATGSQSESEFGTATQPDTPIPSSDLGDNSEIAAAADTTSAAADEWTFDDTPQGSKSSEEDEGRPQLEMPQITLKEHLLEQMRLNIRDPRDRGLIELIIDALDDNGYLIESLEEIHESLPFGA